MHPANNNRGGALPGYKSIEILQRSSDAVSRVTHGSIIIIIIIIIRVHNIIVSDGQEPVSL
jgi:hypothetical protein